MGVFLKFVLHLMANILWAKIGGKGAIPPVRLPKGKKPVSIPVVSPWQTVVVMWTARKMWAAFGGQFKDILASSPNGAAQHLGTLLPDAPAKPKKPGAPKAASPASSAPVAAPRASQTWAGTAKPVPAPAPPSPPAASTPPAAPPMPAPRPAPNYATRPLNDYNAAPDDTSATAPAASSPPVAVPPTPVPPTPVDSPAAPASKLRPGSLLSSLRRRS